MMSRQVLFVFPCIEGFVETPPRSTWWHLYGAIDGYGMLFDPVVQSIVQTIPEWAHDAGSDGAKDAFLITSCADSSERCADFGRAGLYVRPREGRFIVERDVESEKEALTTPTGQVFYPTGYPWALLYDRYAGPGGPWMLGEFPAVARAGEALAIGIDLFNMIFHFNVDWPERRLLRGAEWLRDLLLATGAFERGQTPPGVEDDVRLDFQAYGVNRLQIQRLLMLRRAPRDRVASADSHYQAAVAAWLARDPERVRHELGAAFSALADLRREQSKLDACLCEVPHMGVLLADKGFFELEWPTHSRRTLLSYIDHIQEHGYRASVEGGAGCWRNLVSRFPRLGAAIREQWEAGALDLTNGTYSLPFALLSPLVLQYWQFRAGRDAFRDAFGKCPEYYQAQENSLGLQTPELLRHFGYKGALHISQNRGTAPPDEQSFIRWQSPAGHEVPSLAICDRRLGCKGVHFYLDLPVVFDEYRDKPGPMVYVNFQDLGYVFLRVQMIRAHQYAPVWGRYATARDCFEAARDLSRAPARRYTADDYMLSENVFYWDLTNVDELSQLERAYRGASLLRQTQFLAHVAGQYEELRPAIEGAVPGLCLQEAHDALLVQGGRIGEFHGRSATMETPPYSRRTLGDDLRGIYERTTRQLSDAQRGLLAEGSATLLNASGAGLPFARVVHPELYAGAGLVRHRGVPYAVGPFPALAAAPASGTEAEWADAALPLELGQWRVAVDDGGWLRLAFGDATVGCVPVDSRLGEFRLQRASASTCGPLASIRMAYELAEEGVQTVLADALLHRDSPMAEVSVRYASGRDFDRRDRWGDCLALELDCPAPVRAVWRFNPNVRAETNEDRIVSPYYLATESGPGQAVCFLNEGACFYATDRAGGRVRWLFHVADETQLHRRLALVLGRAEALELSRGWSMGVAPAPPLRRSLPKLREGWGSVSAETLVDDDTLLVSNLLAETRLLTFEDAAGLDLRDAAGQSMVSSREGDAMSCRMGPFELGVLHGIRSAGV